ncbi:hypothetical protein BKA83DRAFT_2546126 [Pisolithus microcarpus]|nr:hypothetical protein BKA83DRAFT_2546126 [Pisolithus microcarpus]
MSFAEFGSSGGQQTDTFPAKPPQHLGYTGTSCNDCHCSGFRSLNPWSTAKGMTYGLLGKTLLHTSNLPVKTDTFSRPPYHDNAGSTGSMQISLAHARRRALATSVLDFSIERTRQLVKGSSLCGAHRCSITIECHKSLEHHTPFMRKHG